MLTGVEVDKRLRWPLGRAERLARRGKLPHIVLPDGAIRFQWRVIRRLLVTRGREVAR
jgi:hypothetical protein